MSRVLLLEPNTLLATMYASALQSAGHDVMVAHTAQQAVHAADERAPQVVIIEMQLPRHNGIEFLHEFRSYSEWQDIPVIIQTLLPPVRMQAAAQVLQDDFGVRAVLYKPATSLADLCQAVQGLLPAAL
jgi:CheY-like chemotaxis protein